MKQTQKMCKSPKVPNATAAYKTDKIVINDYETNCTTIGSNNLHLVKKPQQQQQIINAMSPVYSNPSPGYPQSPYSSPAGLKSPSPQSMKPPTPQPNSYPVMQIIHNNHLLARPIQATQQQNIIKLKPHLNILPKPSASPQPSPKPSVSPQIVIPTNQQATIMPTAQPLLLNQMQQVLTTPSGVHFIVRPQQAKMPTQVQAQTQGLILQQSQPVLQLQPPRSQNLVRVLTNGMQLAPPTTTYVTHLATPQQQAQAQHNIHQGTIVATATSPGASKKKPKKKKQKLDLANIMKLSGIGDEDDIQFESDTSLSESEHNSVHSQPNTPQPTSQHQNLMQQSPQHGQQSVLQHTGGLLQTDGKGKIGNIQISTMQQPTISATATPLVQFQQVLNQGFPGSVIPTSQATTAQGVPFSSFLAPNITINNGLMMQQRSGVAYKLSVSEDGRLILHHDPSAMQQDMQQQQQQVLVQGLFGLNSLVLQPSIDQQVHSQTVQTIQQQSVQTIQQQTVQSQTIQTVQQQSIQPQIQAVQPQTLQRTVQRTIQHQTVSQPLHGQPMQIVQPQPMQNLNQSIQSQTVHSIQSQVQPNIPIALQNHIHGQLQSLIQSQLHQNMSSGSTISIQSQPVSVNSQTLHNLNQPIVVHSQPIQSLISNSSNQNLQSNHQQQQQQQQSTINHTLNSAINSAINPTINLQNQIHQQQQQSQGMQTIMQGMSQPTQTQPILKVQPFQKSQPPVQTVHPQPAQSMHSHQSNEPVHGSPLTPEQVEMLRRNGSITVNGQTYLMQRANVCKTPDACVGDVKPLVKMSPKGKTTVKKVAAKVVSSKAIVADNKSVVEKQVNCVGKDSKALQSPSPAKHVVMQNHVQVQPQIQPQQNQQQPIVLVQKATSQPSALVQPSIQASQPQIVPQPKIHIVPQPKPHQVAPNVQPPPQQPVPTSGNSVVGGGATKQQPEANTQDVDRLLGQIIEETNCPAQNVVPANPPKTITIAVQNSNKTQQQQESPAPQNITTVQLSQEQQQYLQRVKVQIQNLAARYQPGDKDVQAALMLLFEEQNKILISGRLLSPDKVHYHNNYLTIMNPEQVLKSDNDPIVVTSAAVPVTPPNHVAPPSVPKTAPVETISSQQVVTMPNVISKPNALPAVSEAVNAPSLSNVIASSIPSSPSLTTTTTTSQSGPTPHVLPQMPAPNLPPPPPNVRVSSVVHHHPQMNVQIPAPAPPQPPPAPAATSQQPSRYLPNYTKGQLIEQQMNTDQNGAVKPDIHTPFKDKMDTCKRLIRYHCFDQPVLSTKDLGKADEIFELTAKHFIDEFSKMSDKYKYLRLKESMREVPTSELMMLDRMFLAEEQQSLIKLRQDVQEQASLPPSGPPPLIEITPPSREETPEEYDEWACIQKELSSIQPPNDVSKSNNHLHVCEPSGKRTLSSDARFETSRLETLKKFRVDKQKKSGEFEHTQKRVFNQVSSSPQQFFAGSSSRQISHQRALHHYHQQQQHLSHTVHHHAATTQTFQSSASSSSYTMSSVGSASSSNSGPPIGGTDNTIDEQVQSAIDSILNLQQSALDLDDVNSILS